jgi:hypothetical protein
VLAWVTVPFTPPKSTAFKQFVILDHDGVVAALSALDGGQIDEILMKSADEHGGSMGAEVDVKVAKGGGKRNKTRRIEEEMRVTRTRHAAAAKLIEALLERESVGVVHGEFDTEVMDQVSAGMVLQFRGELHLHPLHKADEMLRSFIEVAPKLGQGETAKELKPALKVWEAIVGTGNPDSRLLIEPRTVEDQVPRLLLSVPKDHLQAPLDDVLSEVTILAQVERIISADNESYQVIRMLKGGPASSLEKESVAGTVPEMLPALREIGVDIDMDDIFIEGPALILRAICAYR